MPLLSAFTPLGMLEMTGAKSKAESIYDSMVSGLGKESLSPELGTRQDATFYAQAMGIARLQYRLESAARNDDPLHTVEFLPTREREYRLTPGPLDTLDQRQRALAAEVKLPLGATATNITNALQDLFGDEFVAYRPTPYAEAVWSPATAADDPLNFQRPDVPLKIVRLTDYVAKLATEITVAYEAAGVMAPGSAAPVLLPEDVLVVDPGSTGLEEKTVVISATATTFVARFLMAHHAGAIATTQPFPVWPTTKRHSLVVLKASAARDPVKRTKAHRLLRKLTRSVSTWDIVEETTAGHTGPFQVGVSPLGSTTIGDVTL